jgi:drug/metabolite transporter (DMT)-like permease
MKLRDKIPLRVVIGLCAAVVIDTALQLFWKSAVLSLPGESSAALSILEIFREPLFFAVVCMMGLQFFNWMAVLNKADLSFAQPFTALSYVLVCLLSSVFFNESVDGIQILGIACVLAGVWFISRTGHASHREPGEAAGGMPVGGA